MLRPKHADLSFTETHVLFGPGASLSEEAGGPDEPEDAPLDDAARGEREYVRRRLREELQREPTEGELDEWLRQHTEGY
jgi:hypothetical protein